MDNFFNDGIETRQMIKDHLEKLDENLSWLAKRVSVTTQHLLRVMTKERKLSQGLLERINKAMETDIPMIDPDQEI